MIYYHNVRGCPKTPGHGNCNCLATWGDTVNYLIREVKAKRRKVSIPCMLSEQDVVQYLSDCATSVMLWSKQKKCQNELLVLNLHGFDPL